MDPTQRARLGRTITFSLLLGMLLAGGLVLVFAYRNTGLSPASCADPTLLVECELQRAELRQFITGQLVSGVVLCVVAIGGYFAVRMSDRRAARTG